MNSPPAGGPRKGAEAPAAKKAADREEFRKWRANEKAEKKRRLAEWRKSEPARREEARKALLESLEQHGPDSAVGTPGTIPREIVDDLVQANRRADWDFAMWRLLTCTLDRTPGAEGRAADEHTVFVRRLIAFVVLGFDASRPGQPSNRMQASVDALTIRSSGAKTIRDAVEALYRWDSGSFLKEDDASRTELGNEYYRWMNDRVDRAVKAKGLKLEPTPPGFGPRPGRVDE